MQNNKNRSLKSNKNLNLEVLQNLLISKQAFKYIHLNAQEGVERIQITLDALFKFAHSEEARQLISVAKQETQLTLNKITNFSLQEDIKKSKLEEEYTIQKNEWQRLIAQIRERVDYQESQIKTIKQDSQKVQQLHNNILRLQQEKNDLHEKLISKELESSRYETTIREYHDKLLKIQDLLAKKDLMLKQSLTYIKTQASNTEQQYLLDNQQSEKYQTLLEIQTDLVELTNQLEKVSNDAETQKKNLLFQTQELEKKNAHLEQAYKFIHLNAQEGVERIQFTLDDLFTLADSQEARQLILIAKQETQLTLDKIINFQLQEWYLEIKKTSIEDEYIYQKNEWYRVITQIKERANQQEIQFNAMKMENQRTQQHFDATLLILQKEKNELQEKLIEKEIESSRNEGQIQNYNEKFVKIQELLSQKDQILKQSQKQIKEYITNIEHFEEVIENLKNELSQEAVQKEELKQKLKESQFELSSLSKEQKKAKEVHQSEIENLTNQVNNLRNGKNQQQSQIEVEKQYLKNLVEDLQKKQIGFQQQNEKSQKQITDLSAENEKNLLQLDLKKQELQQLNRTLNDLENFSRKQLDLIKEQEQKLSDAQQINKFVEGNEHLINQLSQKGFQYIEIIEQNQKEIQILKQELQQISDKHHQMNNKLQKLKEENEFQKDQNRQLEQKCSEFDELRERFRKQGELIQIQKEESSKVKFQIESCQNELKKKHSIIEEQNQQLISLQEGIQDYQNQIKEFIYKEKDKIYLIEKLEFQIQSQDNELIKSSLLLKQMENSIQGKNQMSQNLDELQRINQEYLQQNTELKRELRNQEQLYENEIQLLKKQLLLKNRDFLMDQERNQENKDSVFYESLVESKDLEINRLTSILRNLSTKKL